MTTQAGRKAGVHTAVAADGQSLPFLATSFDCAIAIKVLNHVHDRPAFMREARRVLRRGPLVLEHAPKECIKGNWITHYVPSLLGQERFEPESSTVSQMEVAGFRDVATLHVSYTDPDDGSAQALKRFPEMLTEERIMNTSLLSRLPEGERAEAFRVIRHDIQSGHLREVISRYEPLSRMHGDGTFFIGRL
jgi:SAM-dependent methyltransferase